jgi:hypothetical protein
MSAEHNHQPRCCCPTHIDDHAYDDDTCPGCPEHGALAPVHGPGDPWHWSDGTPVDKAELDAAATPYTEQETTK